MTNKIFFRSTLSPLSSLKNENFFEKNFLKSIYLSSPDLYNEILKMDAVSEKKRVRIKKTLSKYWNRYCSRCTPFGTFAGCSILYAEQTSEPLIILAENDKHIEHSRLDSSFLNLLVQSLLEKKDLRNRVIFYPNNTLYEAGEEYRYVGFYTINDKRKYLLTSIDKTFAIYTSIRKAKVGITLPTLISYLSSLMDVSVDEIGSFVEELYKSQILISELDPPITGSNQLETLIASLEKIGVDDKYLLSSLKEINNLLKKPKLEICEYQSIEKKLIKLANLKNPNPHFFHVDSFLSVTQPKINENIINKIIKQSKELMALARPFINNELSDFIFKFKQKYGDEEIELNLALDVESGIGYADVYDNETGEGGIINDLHIEQNSPISSIYKDYIRNFALNKYEKFLSDKVECIEIEEKELYAFPQALKKAKFPIVQSIFGTLIKDDEHEFLFDMKKFGGASSAILLGRFSFGNSDIKNLTTEILSEEEKQEPDCIYAEIVHLPETKTGNVLLRPFLSKYEIPYVGQSGLPRQYQITVDDLLVSVQENEIVLKSKTLNQRVIPRMTTAHNFKYQSLPIYKFLCDLQFQGFWVPGVWDWGELKEFKYLPRVVFKNIILESARWKINATELKNKNDLNKPEVLHKFCSKNQLPTKVIYSEGDNDLLIDFELGSGRQMFKDLLMKHDEITLKECLYTSSNCFVTDKYKNTYTNEILIPFINNLPPAPNASKLSFSGSKIKIKEKFLPNSEWCYFKVYCGFKTAEKILGSAVLKFVEEGLKNKYFEKFFFIRFKDEFPHFRIRFFNPNIATQRALCTDFIEMFKSFVDKKIVDKIIIDTYEREINRYGNQYIESAESLFFFDSLTVLKIIAVLKDVENSSKYRLLFAIRGVDMLLNDFKYDISEKKLFSQFVSKYYISEFGASDILVKQLNIKYREYQNDIFSHLNPLFDKKNNIIEVTDFFVERSVFNKEIISKILNTADFINNKNSYVQSYIHMFLNRLFISNQRKYELIVYFFLDKYYRSEMLMSNKQS